MIQKSLSVDQYDLEMTSSLKQGKPTANILESLKDEKSKKVVDKSSSEGEEESGEEESGSSEEESSEEKEQKQKVIMPKIDIKNMNSKNQSQKSSTGNLAKGPFDERKESSSRHAFESHSNREAKKGEEKPTKKQPIQSATPNIPAAKKPIKTVTSSTTRNSKPEVAPSTKASSKAADLKKPADKKKVMTYEDPQGFDMADDILSKLRAEFIDKKEEDPEFDIGMDASIEREEAEDKGENGNFEIESPNEELENSEEHQGEVQDEKTQKAIVKETPSKPKASDKPAPANLKSSPNNKNLKTQMKSPKKDQLGSPLKTLLADTRKPSGQLKPDSKRSGESKSRLEILREQKRASQIKGKN